MSIVKHICIEPDEGYDKEGGHTISARVGRHSTTIFYDDGDMIRQFDIANKHLWVLQVVSQRASDYEMRRIPPALEDAIEVAEGLIDQYLSDSGEIMEDELRDALKKVRDSLVPPFVGRRS